MIFNIYFQKIIASEGWREKITIFEVNMGGCHSKGEKTYQVDIVVPTTEPSNSFNKFIEIMYFIRVI